MRTGGASISPAKAAVSVLAAEISRPGTPFRSGFGGGWTKRGSGEPTAESRESIDVLALKPNSGVDFLEEVLQGSGLIDRSAKDIEEDPADEVRIDISLEGLRSRASSTVKQTSSSFLDSSEYLSKASRACA